MRFSVERDALKQRIEWVVKATDASAIIKTTAVPGKLIFEASDGMVWRKTECPAVVENEGVVFAPMGQFIKILGVAKGAKVELAQRPGSPNLVGKIGKVDFTLTVAQDPPRWSTVPDVHVIAEADKRQLFDVLKTAESVAGTSAAKDPDSTRGIQLIFQAGAERLTFASTNTRRAIRISMRGTSNIDLHRVAHSAVLTDAIPKLRGDTVQIVQSDSQLLGVSDGVTTSLAPLVSEQRLPPLDRLIDGGKSLQDGADLDRADLIEAMQIAISSGEPLIAFGSRDGDATIASSRPLVGQHSTATTETAIPMMGSPVEFVMDKDTAMPIISAVRSETLRMLRGSGPKDPVYIRELLDDDEGVTIEGVFMPIITERKAA